MSAFFKFIKALRVNVEPQHVRDEAYLAESVDIYDLERRMRELDQRAQNGPANIGLPLGI